jgi:hypothetical protein
MSSIALGRCALLLLFVGLVTTVAGAAETLSTIKSEGSTELTYKAPSGNILRVEIWQTKWDLSFPYKSALLWGGDVGEPVQFVLSSIQISQNERAVFVPLSAYSDLGDVKFASLEPTNEGFVLHLHGGNTATSYDVAFIFSHGYLRTRTVRLRELPNERWEKTRYSFPK